MTQDFAANMMLTTMITALIFRYFIRMHKKYPPLSIMIFEIVGFYGSVVTFFVFAFYAIWIS